MYLPGEISMNSYGNTMKFKIVLLITLIRKGGEYHIGGDVNYIIIATHASENMQKYIEKILASALLKNI
jgi:hypothetical protein